jgi:hypothetical protein
MPRFHNINGEHIQFTAEEESARNAEETAWEEGKPAKALRGFRAKRDSLLVSSDWTQISDTALSDGDKNKWIAYRTLLRDLPETDGFDPRNPTWPDAP